MPEPAPVAAAPGEHRPIARDAAGVPLAARGHVPAVAPLEHRVGVAGRHLACVGRGEGSGHHSAAGGRRVVPEPAVAAVAPRVQLVPVAVTHLHGAGRQLVDVVTVAELAVPARSPAEQLARLGQSEAVAAPACNVDDDHIAAKWSPEDLRERQHAAGAIAARLSRLAPPDGPVGVSDQHGAVLANGRSSPADGFTRGRAHPLHLRRTERLLGFRLPSHRL
eukprot:scaffold16844_cov119-Isochrysis_galbana.AAC.8